MYNGENRKQMNYLNRMRSRLANYLSPNLNKFNEAFLWALGAGYTEYDKNAKAYVEQGYNINPLVYSVVNQMATKTTAVPIYVKEIEDKKAMKGLKRLRSSTKYDMTIQQKVSHILLQNKAFKDGEFNFPMKRPNPDQTWTEWIALYKTFIKLTGNVYIYMLKVEEGPEAGKPMAIYLLPSHLMQIVVGKVEDFLTLESAVRGYILIEGSSYVEFTNEEVIHIKYSNPNYDENGEHLYGQSPLKAALKNIESSNSALDLNIKTLKSGGAFGFIHSKQTPMTEPQAKEIKERLNEMNSSPEDLSKIAGISAEIGFTRLSLTSDELKPFDYLKFDSKQIANCLSWPDALLNNDDGGKYDKQAEEKKRAITDNIVPDLELLIDALNNEFLPCFKGYENMVLEFDVMELPEMQDDAGKLSEWLYNGLDKGVFTRNEIRQALRWGVIDNPDMDRQTVQNDIISLEEALDNDFGIGNEQ